MDCNKEEAIRARDIAEKKMQSKDFIAARKIVIKAQQLYPNLENISQMLMVCDVHCSSEKRLSGNEMDWYGILQVEQTANEEIIKKQYRKFALSLHPDKNKFPGAEAAFKLIGEAQRVLLDRDKRSLHDMRRKPTVPHRPPQKASSYSGAGLHSNYRNNPLHQQPPQHAQSGFSGSITTFWTVCPFCSVKYQYYKEVVNRCLRCQNCKNPFIAFDSNAPGFQSASNLNRQTTFPQQKDIPNHGSFKAEVGNRGKPYVRNPGTKSSKKVENSSGTATEKLNRKMKRKRATESSESCSTGNSSDFEEDMSIGENGERSGGQNSAEPNPRRSTRQRQQVSYKENLSDHDDFAGLPKKVNRNGSHFSIKEPNGGAKEDIFKGSLQNGARECLNKTDDHSDWQKCSEDFDDTKSDSSSHGIPDLGCFDCPDADFNDFDKLRADGSFDVGQIWSIYDDAHAMPRYYARMKKVFSGRFKVQMTWLEPDPDDEDKIKWVRKGLPVSCGTYKFGKSTFSDNLHMFSHLVVWEKGNRRDRFEIFPQKGETWAIFRNWDVRWTCNADALQYEYDFVEILSDYAEVDGVYVAFLCKIKGFKSLFCRKVREEMELQIPPSELYRFSHRIPSFVMTGEEREGVPKGSLELDPAALPTNLLEVTIPEDLRDETGNICPTDMCAESSQNTNSTSGLKENVSLRQSDKMNRMHIEEDPSAPEAEAIEIPAPEFYNFDGDKSHDKFQVNQIWALYSDEDGLPKYYGQIKKVAFSKEFSVDIMWLFLCGLPDNTIPWHDKKMPISCGRFRINRKNFQSFTSTAPFSHLIKADSGSKRNEYFISPRKGEIWALHRNWTAEIECFDLKNCEYDVAEVINEEDLHIQVLRLELVDGLKSVFKPEVKEGSPLIEEISRVELLKFSHQIPAFRLTEERGGSMRGFLELDPAALPVYYFS